MTTLSAILQITKIDAGNQNQQGVTVNEAIDILDAAAGLLVKAMPDSNYTLTSAAIPDEAHYGAIKFTGTPSTGRNVIVPDWKMARTIWNATTQTLTIKTAAGTGTAIASGKAAIVACDGTNVGRITPDTTP